jgi:DNA-binding LacI/PurR family transcriptional regulator
MSGRETLEPPATPKRKRAAPKRATVTAADVARAAGVSRSVVSRAFTPGAPVAEETRKLILSVASRLGYAPNVLARSLITGRSDLVAVVVNTVADLWDTFFFDKLFQALQAMGKQPLIVHTHAAADLHQVLQDGASYQVDGALVFADNVTPAMIRSVFRAPAVVMLNRLERPSDRVDAVRIDERTDLGRIVEALLRSGHRRISYVSGRRTASFDDERFLAVRDALARRGLAPFGPATGGDFSYETGLAAAATLFGLPEQPDAILCACDAIAFGVLDVARSRGLRVPDDLSIVGFDDIPLAAWPPYRLTTVNQNVEAIIAAAVDLLGERLAEPSKPAEVRLLATRIVDRSSARLTWAEIDQAPP